MHFTIEAGTGRLHRLEDGVLPYKDERPNPPTIADMVGEQPSLVDALADW